MRIVKNMGRPCASMRSPTISSCRRSPGPRARTAVKRSQMGRRARRSWSSPSCRCERPYEGSVARREQVVAPLVVHESAADDLAAGVDEHRALQARVLLLDEVVQVPEYAISPTRLLGGLT